MSPAQATAQPLIPDAEANAEKIANLEQILQMTLAELTDLSRFLYVEARHSGNNRLMERSKQTGELFKSFEGMLPDAF